ncbi:MAG: MobA/MobL family protein, partial [Bdellovibrionales bacterium]|nr:MobA/MobL family protein [Bdellovibrionales bacterium]
MSAMWAHDNTVTRANGRIAETLILSFDNRMSLEHRKAATQNFLLEVTFDEQIKAVAFLHDNDPENLHAHVVVIDSNEDGEPVGHFGRSGTFRREHSPVKGNPTEWLRKQWEDSCNAVLEEHEYDFRVDRRSLDKRLEAT